MDNTDSIKSQDEQIQKQRNNLPVEHPLTAFAKLEFFAVIAFLIMVGVSSGWMWWQKNMSQVAIPTLTPQPSPTVTFDPTANWQTYRNEEYGFEFRYPGELFFEINNKNPKSIVTLANRQGEPDILVLPDDMVIVVQIQELNGQLVLNEWLSDNYPYSELDENKIIEIGNRPAYWVTFKNETQAGMPMVFIPLKNKVLMGTGNLDNLSTISKLMAICPNHLSRQTLNAKY